MMFIAERRTLARALATAAIVTMAAVPGMAQTTIYRRPGQPQGQPPVSVPSRPSSPDEIGLSGPRFGLTILSPETVEALYTERGLTVDRLVSQFGWQFEKNFYVNPDGLAVVTEFIPLLSGLEQGLALPSLNWMVGVRSPSGMEFGLGPNITPVGVGLVIAGGVTIKTGSLNVPLNFAYASSKYGARVSIMTGFSIRRR
jgi:hypothetical protein